MDDQPHIQAAKWIAKTKLSHISSMVESRTVEQTIIAMLRLVKELEPAINKTFLLDNPN